jgi:hypothetical protein
MTEPQNAISTFARRQPPEKAPFPSTRGAVEAELVFALTRAQRPQFYMYEPPAGVPRLVGEYGPRRVWVHDGRERSEPFDLDVHGFSLHRHASSLADAYDDREVRAVYYPEIEQLVQDLSGAERVLVFDHNVRSDPEAKAGRRGVAEPVRRVHNDYTDASARRRLEQLLPHADAALRRRWRFAFINVWRPLFGPVQDTPLAVCDARSIDADDLVTIELLYRDRIGENYNVVHSAKHRWYYFSEMGADEVLLLKCFDSAEDGRARFGAHAAFDDPRAPRNVRPRESIEIRTIAFFPPH